MTRRDRFLLEVSSGDDLLTAVQVKRLLKGTGVQVDLEFATIKLGRSTLARATGTPRAVEKAKKKGARIYCNPAIERFNGPDLRLDLGRGG